MALIRRDEKEAMQVEPGLFGLKLIDGELGSQNVSLIRGWLKSGARHSSHTHDVDEAVVFLGGRGVVELAGQSHNVGPGDAIHIPPGVVHSTLNTGDEDLWFIAAFGGNLITSNPLQTTDRAGRGRATVGSLLRHRLAWLLRRMANRLSPRD